MRRALQWLERSGMLPRSRLEYGLVGASGHFQHTNRQSVFGTAHEIPVPGSTNPQSRTGEYQCLLPGYFWHNAIDGVPMLPQGVYPDTGLGIQSPAHQGFQGISPLRHHLLQIHHERAPRQLKKRHEGSIYSPIQTASPGYQFLDRDALKLHDSDLHEHNDLVTAHQHQLCRSKIICVETKLVLA